MNSNNAGGGGSAAGGTGGNAGGGSIGILGGTSSAPAGRGRDRSASSSSTTSTIGVQHQDNRSPSLSLRDLGFFNADPNRRIRSESMSSVKGQVGSQPPTHSTPVPPSPVTLQQQPYEHLVSQWSEAHVQQWANDNGLGAFVGVFAQARITGADLVVMSVDMLNGIGITSPSDCLRILQTVRKLLGRSSQDTRFNTPTSATASGGSGLSPLPSPSSAARNPLSPSSARKTPDPPEMATMFEGSSSHDLPTPVNAAFHHSTQQQQQHQAPPGPVPPRGLRGFFQKTPSTQNVMPGPQSSSSSSVNNVGHWLSGGMAGNTLGGGPPLSLIPPQAGGRDHHHHAYHHNNQHHSTLVSSVSSPNLGTVPSPPPGSSPIPSMSPVAGGAPGTFAHSSSQPNLHRYKEKSLPAIPTHHHGGAHDRSSSTPASLLPSHDSPSSPQVPARHHAVRHTRPIKSHDNLRLEAALTAGVHPGSVSPSGGSSLTPSPQPSSTTSPHTSPLMTSHYQQMFQQQQHQLQQYREFYSSQHPPYSSMSSAATSSSITLIPPGGAALAAAAPQTITSGIRSFFNLGRSKQSQQQQPQPTPPPQQREHRGLHSVSSMSSLLGVDTSGGTAVAKTPSGGSLHQQHPQQQNPPASPARSTAMSPGDAILAGLGNGSLGPPPASPSAFAARYAAPGGAGGGGTSPLRRRSRNPLQAGTGAGGVTADALPQQYVRSASLPRNMRGVGRVQVPQPGNGAATTNFLDGVLALSGIGERLFTADGGEASPASAHSAGGFGIGGAKHVDSPASEVPSAPPGTLPPPSPVAPGDRSTSLRGPAPALPASPGGPQQPPRQASQHPLHPLHLGNLGGGAGSGGTPTSASSASSLEMALMAVAASMSGPQSQSPGGPQTKPRSGTFSAGTAGGSLPSIVTTAAVGGTTSPAGATGAVNGAASPSTAVPGGFSAPASMMALHQQQQAAVVSGGGSSPGSEKASLSVGGGPDGASSGTQPLSPLSPKSSGGASPADGARRAGAFSHERLYEKCIKVTSLGQQSHIIDVSMYTSPAAIREYVFHKFRLPLEERSQYALFGLSVSGHLDTTNPIDDETLWEICRSPNVNLKSHLVLKKKADVERAEEEELLRKAAKAAQGSRNNVAGGAMTGTGPRRGTRKNTVAAAAAAQMDMTLPRGGSRGASAAGGGPPAPLPPAKGDDGSGTTSRRRTLARGSTLARNHTMSDTSFAERPTSEVICDNLGHFFPALGAAGGQAGAIRALTIASRTSSSTALSTMGRTSSSTALSTMVSTPPAPAAPAAAAAATASSGTSPLPPRPLSTVSIASTTSTEAVLEGQGAGAAALAAIGHDVRQAMHRRRISRTASQKTSYGRRHSTAFRKYSDTVSLASSQGTQTAGSDTQQQQQQQQQQLQQQQQQALPPPPPPAAPSHHFDPQGGLPPQDPKRLSIDSLAGSVGWKADTVSSTSTTKRADFGARSSSPSSDQTGRTVKDEWRDRMAILGASGGLFLSAEDPGWTKEQKKAARRRSIRLLPALMGQAPVEGPGARRCSTRVKNSQLFTPIPEEQSPTSPMGPSLEKAFGDKMGKAVAEAVGATPGDADRGRVPTKLSTASSSGTVRPEAFGRKPPISVKDIVLKLDEDGLNEGEEDVDLNAPLNNAEMPFILLSDEEEDALTPSAVVSMEGDVPDVVVISEDEQGTSVKAEEQRIRELKLRHREAKISMDDFLSRSLSWKGFVPVPLPNSPPASPTTEEGDDMASLKKTRRSKTVSGSKRKSVRRKGSGSVRSVTSSLRRPSSALSSQLTIPSDGASLRRKSSALSSVHTVPSVPEDHVVPDGAGDEPDGESSMEVDRKDGGDEAQAEVHRSFDSVPAEDTIMISRELTAKPSVKLAFEHLKHPIPVHPEITIPSKGKESTEPTLDVPDAESRLITDAEGKAPVSPTTMAASEGSAESTPMPTSIASGSDAAASSAAATYGSMSDFPVFTPDDERPTHIDWIKGDLIGKGSFGRVYYGVNLTTKEVMAVKQVELVPMVQRRGGPAAAAEANSNLRQRMVDALKIEVLLLRELDHQNIVQYLGFDVEGNTVSVFLQYVDGGSVASLLSRYGGLEEDLVRSVTCQILSGLEYLHERSIIHRDIKGANILIDHEGVAKISDFGISKKLEYKMAYRLNSRMSLQGSVYWMAPEVIKAKGYSAKIDIWSLGCVTLEMFTGNHPWKHFDEMQTMWKLGKENAPPIPNEVHLEANAKDFLAKCFTIEPEDRPTASQLLYHPFADVDPREFDFKTCMRLMEERRLAEMEEDSDETDETDETDDTDDTDETDEEEEDEEDGDEMDEDEDDGVQMNPPSSLLSSTIEGASFYAEELEEYDESEEMVVVEPPSAR
ncbi:ATP binding [Phlyctochytrium bullatum]|nr:ATP binding [Phlyctochytrium bullatum]